VSRASGHKIYHRVQTSVPTQIGRSLRTALRAAAEIVVASLGGVLVAWALAAGGQWFDAHFLPAFFVSRDTYVLAHTLSRVAAAAIGLALVFLARPRIGRFVARSPAGTLHVALAIVLACAASELILRQLHLHAAAEEPAGRAPRRRLDPRLGWTFVPARAVHHAEGGRPIEYAFDAAGHRVSHVDAAVDPSRPTILFTGESMMVGEGLTWDESVPAQTGAMLGIQSANLAVSAYASDQAYLRLQAELPRFRQPVAIVSLFTPALFDRNMDDDRPHLGEGLVWLPAVERWRLLTILRLVVRYRRTETIDRGVAVTREVLRATAALARARGAVPLIVVPQFVPEPANEQALRHRILDGSSLPIVRVELDLRWRIRGDGHPDARAARAIATAIAHRLRP
jgi:hypothetical protein